MIGKQIAHGFIQTLRGHWINLQTLSMKEKRFWLKMFLLAGGIGLFEQQTKELSNKGVLIDPQVFHDLARASLRKTFEASEVSQALGGPLGELLEDLELRLGHIHHGWSVDAIRHDPRLFLKFVFEDSKSLGDFSQKTGLNYSQSSKVLASLERALENSGDISQTHIDVRRLKNAAHKTGHVFQTHPSTDAVACPLRVTCRDTTNLALGSRLSTISRLIPADQDFESWVTHAEPLLLPEITARIGRDTDIPSALLRTFWLNARLFSESPKKLQASLVVFHIDSVGELADWVWVFLALEHQWFEECGIFPLVVQETPPLWLRQIATVVSVSGDSGDGESIELERGKKAKKNEALSVDLDLILLLNGRVRFGGLRYEKDLGVQFNRIRRWALNLLDARDLLPFNMAVLDGWSRVFGSTLSAHGCIGSMKKPLALHIKAPLS